MTFSTWTVEGRNPIIPLDWFSPLSPTSHPLVNFPRVEWRGSSAV